MEERTAAEKERIVGLLQEMVEFMKKQERERHEEWEKQERERLERRERERLEEIEKRERELLEEERKKRERLEEIEKRFEEFAIRERERIEERKKRVEKMDKLERERKKRELLEEAFRHDAAAAGPRTPTVATSSQSPLLIPLATPLATPSATPLATPSATPPAIPTAIPLATPPAITLATPLATPSAIPLATPSATPPAIPLATPSATPPAIPLATPSATPPTTPLATLLATASGQTTRSRVPAHPLAFGRKCLSTMEEHEEKTADHNDEPVNRHNATTKTLQQLGVGAHGHRQIPGSKPGDKAGIRVEVDRSRKCKNRRRPSRRLRWRKFKYKLQDSVGHSVGHPVSQKKNMLLAEQRKSRRRRTPSPFKTRNVSQSTVTA